MQALLAKHGYKRSGIIQNLDEADPELVYVKELRAKPSRQAQSSHRQS